MSLHKAKRNADLVDLRSAEEAQGLERWTVDRRFGIRIPAGCLNRIIKLSQKADRVETGGILVGRYVSTHHCAEVTDVSGAPSDSKHSVSRFLRGILGLQRWLNRLWSKNGTYYLGEWHYHPYAEAVPSSMDEDEIEDIAKSANYQCPEPLLLIVGGDPHHDWHWRAFVWTADARLTELVDIPEHHLGQTP